jgi:hypothetical protein
MRNDLDRSMPSARIPLAVKLVYSVFVACHLWINLGFYGPMNYLWFCDIAVLTTAVALWTESSLLMSMTAVAFLGPAIIWNMDVASELISSHSWWGVSAYLGDSRLPMSLRVASVFHLWLPFLLFYSLYRLRYDRRALWAQTVVAIVVVILSRTVGGPPPAHSLHDVVNINCAYGTSDQAPQTKWPTWFYLTKLIVKCWITMYLPLHLILGWVFKRRSKRAVVWEPQSPALAGAAVQQA